MTLHRIWMVITVLAGMPVAGMGLLLAIASIRDHTPATLLLLVPLVLIIWASMLFVQLIRPKRGLSFVRVQLTAFYLLTGGVSVWATTWEPSRDGYKMPMFSPWASVGVGAFFLIPLMHLLLVHQHTELGAAPNCGPAQQFGNSGAGGGPPSVS